LALFYVSAGPIRNFAVRDACSKSGTCVERGTENAELAALYFAAGQVARCEFRIREAVSYMRRAMEVTERVDADGAWCAAAAQYGVYLIQTGRLTEPGRWHRRSGSGYQPFGPNSRRSERTNRGQPFSELIDFREARKWWRAAPMTQS